MPSEFALWGGNLAEQDSRRTWERGLKIQIGNKCLKVLMSSVYLRKTWPVNCSGAISEYYSIYSKGPVFCVERQSFCGICNALNSSLIEGKIRNMASFVNLRTTRACYRSLQKISLKRINLFATLSINAIKYALFSIFLKKTAKPCHVILKVFLNL